MTNENIIEIKKQQKGWFGKGFLFLILMLVSLYISLMPLISAFANKNSSIFYVVGFSLFIIFTFAFVLNIYKTCKPDNALVLSARGFIDYINIGEGIEIEWTNVTAVKMLGKTNMPYLGVTLENTDYLISKMKKKAAAEMLENITQNLPTVLISQSTVKAPVKELKDTFTKFVREARLLEKNAQQKTKSNPFSTDDVLRAFGRLPKDEENNAPEKTTSNIPNIEVTSDANIGETKEFGENANASEGVNVSTATREFSSVENVTPSIPAPFEVPGEITNEAAKDSTSKSASESFYEALRSKANAKNNTTSEATALANESTEEASTEEHIDSDISNEEMPEEMQELLNRAKSSKITEIEELLSSNDIPYSLSREKSISEVNLTTESEAFEESVLADETDSQVSETPDRDSFESISLNISFDDETELQASDDMPSPSLENLFDDNDNDNENLDVNISLESEENTDTDDEPVDDLASMIEKALSNVETDTPDDSNDDSNLGDTKEFIFNP